MKKSLCLLTALLMVCFVHVAFAGSGNTSFRSVNHKGYNTKAPENTLPAFERSAEMGYRYVETDISFTKDGVPVLLHGTYDALLMMREVGTMWSGILLICFYIFCFKMLKYGRKHIAEHLEKDKNAPTIFS